MKATIQSINLPQHPEAIMFVNGIKARNIRGLLYMWRNIRTLQTSPAQADGCRDVKAGIVGPNEFVVVSYWQSENDLKHYFQSEAHRRMMRYYYQNLHNLELYNETYHPTHAGKYNAAHGMAKVYPLVVP